MNLSDEHINDTIRRMQLDVDGPHAALVDAVHREVVRGRPWWRRPSYERVATLVGAVQVVRADPSIRFELRHPSTLTAIVSASGLRGRHVAELAWKVATVMLEIERWGHRP